MSGIEIKNIFIDKLIPDPLNKDSYPEGDISSLSDSIKENGFLGVIAAYPIGDGTYMIESGHRRYEAAKRAGMDSVMVQITSPPDTEVERRKRLSMWNLHSRDNGNPMIMARACGCLSRTYDMENEERKKAGLKPILILETVARDLECSTSSVTKYKRLLTLIPELQSLIESGDYPWVSIGKAAQLEPDQQKYLYERIKGQSRAGGPSEVSGKWIESEIDELKHYKFVPKEKYNKYVYDRNLYNELFNHKEESEAPAEAESSKKKKNRRCDSYKNTVKSLQYLEIAANSDSLLKRSDVKKTAEVITKIENTLETLKSRLRDKS